MKFTEMEEVPKPTNSPVTLAFTAGFVVGATAMAGLITLLFWLTGGL